MPLPDDYEIVEITAPKSVVGRSIKDLGLLSKYSLNLVTIIESFGNVELHIKGVIEEDEIIKDNYVLVVFGLNKDVERFIDING